MKKNDWYGLGASILLHVLLLVLFGTLTLGVSEPEPIGYIEVELGPLSEGRPVQRAPEERKADVPEPPKPEPQPEPKTAPPEEARPVDLARQEEEIVEEEKVESPETETISPVEQSEKAEVEKDELHPDRQPVAPEGGGSTEGTSGDADGDEGEGQDEEKAAPFNIEGLNRSLVYWSRPAYPEKVNADIKVRIAVDPQGRVVQIFPLLKGNPLLERAVRDALQRWRFNALPQNAPQELQTGIVTFRFRVE